MNYGFNPHTHKGCDKMRSCVSYALVLFQSTHPRGVRQCSDCPSFCPVDVSIHAPTRGATNVQSGLFKSQTVSIHAPTRGATVCGFSFLLEFLRFNPRTHEGCDSFSYALLLKFISFNPRTHEGCDFCALV